jgi:hypothetical protein
VTYVCYTDHLTCHSRSIIKVTSLQHSRYQHCSGDVFCYKINAKCGGKFWPVACYIISRYLQIFTLFETGVVPRRRGFGGLVVSMLASGTQVRGFAPGRSRRIFFGRKNPQHAFLRKGSKAVCSMSQICSISKNPITYRGIRKL